LTGLKRLDIGRIQLTGAGIQTVKEFKSLEYLQLPHGINDEDLTVIKGLNSLEELWIQNSPITNKCLSCLSDLKSLRKLLLNNGRGDGNMEVTGSGLAYIKELPLTYLKLYRLKLDESRLIHLAGLKQLEELDVQRMPLRDEDLAVIGKLTKLKQLFFDSDTVSDGAMEYLAGLTALEDFSPWISMTDDGLSHLINLEKLQRLQIKGNITEKGLSHLAKLKALRNLRIVSANDFSNAGMEQLQKNLPMLQRLNVAKDRKIMGPPRTGTLAPRFSVKTIDDKEITLEDYHGKVVLLYFWGTWCGPCVASTPGLKKLYEQLCQYDGFAMIGLAIDNDESGIRRHIEQYGLTWPQVRLGLNSQVAEDYGISAVPAYILVGPDGRVLLSKERDWDKLKAAVVKALRKQY
jgi:peroxiredoxin/Leucine-rich repeat (LRR) protein